MGDIAIRVENLGKRYRLGQRLRYRTFRDAVSGVLSAPFRGVHSYLSGQRPSENAQKSDDFIWALKEVSFDVKHGEAIGIIGRNGAGKSTLLKILSRITKPSEGCAEIHGRVGSLLEVGTGFHPELTGRENIYLNGAVLGIKKWEIGRKFDGIVAFAELDKFIDTPVKHYSTGMYMRLAFAVAAHLESEILLVDEVLAVGDAAFQKKCMGKMREVGREGRTVVFVSHNMGAIAELCDRAVLLDQGRQIADGDVAGTLGAYARLSGLNAPQAQYSPDSSLPSSIISLKLCNQDGVETCAFDIGEGITVSILYRVATRLRGLQLTVTVSRNMVDVIHSFDTDDLTEIPDRDPGLYRVDYTIPGMFLKSGIYSIRVGAGTPYKLFQDFESALRFEIEERSINTHMKGYRRGRPGHVISPGVWKTRKLE